MGNNLRGSQQKRLRITFVEERFCSKTTFGPKTHKINSENRNKRECANISLLFRLFILRKCSIRIITASQSIGRSIMWCATVTFLEAVPCFKTKSWLGIHWFKTHSTFVRLKERDKWGGWLDWVIRSPSSQ